MEVDRIYLHEVHADYVTYVFECELQAAIFSETYFEFNGRWVVTRIEDK